MVLLGSLISEGGTLYMAVRAMTESAKQNGMSLYDYGMYLCTGRNFCNVLRSMQSEVLILQHVIRTFLEV